MTIRVLSFLAQFGNFDAYHPCYLPLSGLRENFFQKSFSLFFLSPYSYAKVSIKINKKD